MDDPFAGDDRQHKSWRDLPPTPPLVWPTTPPLATAAAGAGASPMPAAGASRRPRRRLDRRHRRPGRRHRPRRHRGARHRQPSRGAAGAAREGRWPGRAGQGGRACSHRAMSRSRTRPRGCCPRSCRSRPAARIGSGFVAADGGLILTASHVVGRSDDGHAPAPGRHEHLRHRGRGRQVHRHRRHPGRGERCDRSASPSPSAPSPTCRWAR